MKKKLHIITTIMLSALLLSLSSCLKDSSYVDFSQVGTVVEFPLGGLVNFAPDAITPPGPLDTVQFAVNVASPSIPSTATSVTIGVDNSIIAPYNTANPSVTYLQFPTNAFTFPDKTISIPAGTRTAILTLVIDKSKLDPSLSYMLPIRIKNAGGLNISGNMGIHYYHVIGNDFAGTYNHDFTRVPAAGNYVGHPATISPVSPLQFEVAGGYYTGTVRYEVTFTKTGNGASALYSNFAVSINSDDATNILNGNGISVTVPPIIVGYDPAKSYTFAQVTSGFLTLQYSVLGGSGARVNTDKYYK